MVVKDILLENFRNYSKSETKFSDNVNIIIGKNAQGKTNLIEGVYYLTGGRSFRGRSDKDLIKLDSDFARVRATVFTQQRDQKIEANINRYKKKVLFVNGTKLRTSSELSGKLTAVLFCPDDLDIIRATATYRRRLLDQCISQLRPRYAAAITEYRRIYDHKSKILRSDDPSMMAVLDEFNMRMCEVSAVLINYRARFSKLLAQKAKVIHSEFSDGKENLNIVYTTVKTITDPMKKPSELLPQLIEHQQSHKRAEVDSRKCLSGAHKDDLEISINGMLAKYFASQGQARTAAISIKLAERDIHFEDRGEYPVLLLDDVLSELDSGRQNFILNKINDGQVFITCCEDQSISERTGGQVIKVINGEIVGD